MCGTSRASSPTRTCSGRDPARLLDLNWSSALLLGAVVGSTDAAAVFAALRFTALRRRIANILAIESGFNDPMAVALTIGLISWITQPDYGIEDIILLLIRQFWLGLLIGIGIGLLASRMLAWIPSELSGFAPVATMATAAVAYGAADAAGGSGFLCVYIVALFIGNRPTPYRRAVVGFHEGLAFAAQVALFVSPDEAAAYLRRAAIQRGCCDPRLARSARRRADRAGRGSRLLARDLRVGRALDASRR